MIIIIVERMHYKAMQCSKDCVVIFVIVFYRIALFDDDIGVFVDADVMEMKFVNCLQYIMAAQISIP